MTAVIVGRIEVRMAVVVEWKGLAKLKEDTRVGLLDGVFKEVVNEIEVEMTR